MTAGLALARKATGTNTAQLYLAWSADWVEAPNPSPPKRKPSRPKAAPQSGTRMPRQRERPQELDLQFVELVNAWISAEVDRMRAQLAHRRPMSPAAKQVATLNVDRMSAMVRRARFALESAVREEAEARA